MRKLFLILLMTVMQLPAFTQKVKKVEGEYTYIVPSHVTLEYAINYAIEQARRTAIANKFGTTMLQNNVTNIENVDGKSKINMTFISESDLNGIWIGDIKKPIINQSVIDGQLVIRAEVWGRARERVSADVDFHFSILRNGKDDDKNSSVEFKNGDDLYLSFLSPVNGYLAVYLVDSDNQAFCLLPYRDQKSGIYQVNANQRYLFFSAKDAPKKDSFVVDEYQMTSGKPLEVNTIYLIFSPNEFVKAVDQNANDLLPRQLSYEAFLRWLAKCKSADKRMNEKHVTITVKK